MQIVHVPDNPTQVNPDTWWITDGIEARTSHPANPNGSRCPVWSTSR